MTGVGINKRSYAGKAYGHGNSTTPASKAFVSTFLVANEALVHMSIAIHIRLLEPPLVQTGTPLFSVAVRATIDPTVAPVNITSTTDIGTIGNSLGGPLIPVTFSLTTFAHVIMTDVVQLLHDQHTAAPRRYLDALRTGQFSLAGRSRSLYISDLALLVFVSRGASRFWTAVELYLKCYADTNCKPITIFKWFTFTWVYPLVNAPITKDDGWKLSPTAPSRPDHGVVLEMKSRSRAEKQRRSKIDECGRMHGISYVVVCYSVTLVALSAYRVDFLIWICTHTTKDGITRSP
ncbi:hypothetical protein BU15DRAFT_66862 [Melanogaster broomeanus]|nr:hypothetical protein BU15DRAFT_66862 [Melanogaster broomeanus]